MEGSEERVASISKARSYEEMAEFWDTHSLEDYRDQIEEVDLEVCVKRRVAVDPEVYTEVAERARQRGLSPETVINLWLADKLREVARASNREPASVTQ